MSADLEQLKSENATLKNSLQAFSGQLRARKQLCDELYELNINLRASNILQDDQIKILINQINELNIKIKELEKIKSADDLASLD